MSYKIERPKNAPDWFVPGIVCKVWYRGNPTMRQERTIVWCNNKKKDWPYLDSNGVWWDEVEPVEQWVPKAGETIVVWNENSRKVTVMEKIIPQCTAGNNYAPITQDWIFAGCPMDVKWWEKQDNIWRTYEV